MKNTLQRYGLFRNLQEYARKIICFITQFKNPGLSYTFVNKNSYDTKLCFCFFYRSWKRSCTMNPAFFFGGYFLFRYFCSLIKNENYGK